MWMNDNNDENQCQDSCRKGKYLKKKDRNFKMLNEWKNFSCQITVCVCCGIEKLFFLGRVSHEINNLTVFFLFFLGWILFCSKNQLTMDLDNNNNNIVIEKFLSKKKKTKQNKIMLSNIGLVCFGKLDDNQ